MTQTRISRKLRSFAQHTCIVALPFLLSATLSGCIAVGYSSGGGWFLWPGGIGFLFVLLLLFFLLRRRR